MKNEINQSEEYFQALHQAKQCADRNDVEVDYILPETRRPIGVAELSLSRKLPKNLVGKLPDPRELENQIITTLEDFDFIKKDNPLSTD